MPTLTERLRDETGTFIGIVGTTPFFVEDPTYTPTVKAHTDGGAPHDMYKIMGRDRIAYVTAAFNGGQNRYEAQITAQHVANALPCYWLPWWKDGAVQIKLKPSKKATQAHLQGHHLTTGTATDSSSLVLDPNAVWQDRGIEGEDPSLFFTGMMNGCSLFVSGDPTCPVAYHINRASFEQAETQLLLADKKDRDREINRLKTKQMTTDFKRFDASFGRAVKHGKQGEVTPVTQHRRNPLAYPGETAATKKRSDLIRSLVNGPKGQRYKIRAQLTTAFGVRQADSKWRFYKQDIYTYAHMDELGNPDNTTGGVAATRVERFF